MKEVDVLDSELLSQLTVRLLKINAINVDSGAQHSIKCQYAQIENIIRCVVQEMTEHAVGNMQSSYDTDMFNASSDGGQPLIDLESAKCAVKDYLCSPYL